ncbi:DUF6058 family natural product biosynthesis protein [Veronia pacifica]|uniref:Uncharacterized protein n=1 Tax=Veronia pacifica TaxID=1080227 RepID=A0A1C3EPU3_9GAMM|nr:DUF6058 family natural product biosynthesis protein [Veronia pacifica]ODA35212.1 hypothetical protein A8L45_04680 [Veronia pacifica]
MKLIKYLNDHFITQSELLELSKVTEEELMKLQHRRLMPQCSYKLKINVESDSFFGAYSEHQELEYYAKGYISWVTAIKRLQSSNDAYLLFASRYKAALNNLKSDGFVISDHKFNEGLELHIEEQWAHFLNGTYGLCTKSGLPEDIAAKALATTEINELTEWSDLDEKQLSRLERAVNLLDSASSLFAPHERLKSSRHRLVDDVRREYKLDI